MTEQNQAPETATASAAVPTLTLDTDSLAKDKADLDQAVAALEKSAATPAAVNTAEAVEATLADMDTSMLSDAEKKSIEDFVQKIDIENPDHVLQYGADAQKKVADFSDSALATVRTDQTDEVGDMLVKLVGEIKGFGDSVLSGIKNFFGIKSPSRVMRDQVGKMLGEGIGIGITKSTRTAVHAAEASSDAILGAFDTNAGINAGLVSNASLGAGTAQTAQLTADAAQASDQRPPVRIGQITIASDYDADRLLKIMGVKQGLYAKGVVS